VRRALNHSRLALFAGLFLAIAAVLPSRAAGDASRGARAKGVLSLAPLFDTHRRFKVKETAALRFRIQGAQVRPDEVSFSLRHGTESASAGLPAKESKKGVFEVRFTPPAPGQYWIAAAVGGAPTGSIPAVRLGVVGVVDGLVEVSPEEDPGTHRSKMKHGARGR
jgi:hypothetical protein